jgi:hypothetical protein
MYIEVNKSGDSYSVTPNADPTTITYDSIININNGDLSNYNSNVRLTQESSISLGLAVSIDTENLEATFTFYDVECTGDYAPWDGETYNISLIAVVSEFRGTDIYSESGGYGLDMELHHETTLSIGENVTNFNVQVIGVILNEMDIDESWTVPRTFVPCDLTNNVPAVTVSANM